MNNSILPARFYGNSFNKFKHDIEYKIERARKQQRIEFFDRPRSLFQPKLYKEEFWKQNDALAIVAEHDKDDDILCCFVFQDESERRRFIVTYPKDFWMDAEHLSMDKRVFYEVIPEFSPCFLYYDLEFEIDLNEDKNEIQMTQTLIDVTCEYINKYWKHFCNESMVINLDSSRPGKFSKHLIFNTKNVAFANNHHVGYFVKTICAEITNYILQENVEHDILSKFNKTNLEELFVETSKGKKFFVDLNVYTKNRHFRVYKATKWGKNSHLIRAAECKYTRDKKSKIKDLDLFLDSLISYLPRKQQMELLYFNENKDTCIQSYSEHKEKFLKQPPVFKEYPKSPYPVLDEYISEFVKPGKIRETKYIESSRLIIYEITGNRYCENIGRCHKSNNVYYIVDINKKEMYQKCHDEDCNYFCSAPKSLPAKVSFYFNDEADFLLSNIEDFNVS